MVNKWQHCFLSFSTILISMGLIILIVRLYTEYFKDGGARNSAFTRGTS